MAERTGKYVVEFRNEEGNRPRIVAIPSEKSIKRRLEADVGNKEEDEDITLHFDPYRGCLLYTSPSPRDKRQSRMPSSA